MRNTTKVSLLFVFAVSIGAAAHGTSGSQTVKGTFPATVPFSLDAAGNSVTIPFDIDSGNVGAKRHVMIGIDVPRSADFPAVEDVRVNTRLLRIRVFYDDHGTHVPVETEDTETIIARNTGKARPRADATLCRLHLYAAVDGESSLSACGFYAKRDGHYVAEVSTIEPMPAFKGVATTARVDDYYNTGE